MTCNVLEFFAGIGGLARAWPEARIRAAIDINLHARDVYLQNFPHPFVVREIESMTTEELCEFEVDVWWLSPPCQPYSRRGKKSDVADPRSASLLRLIDALDVCRPESIGLENVVGFESSQVFQRLMQSLEQAHYHVATLHLCPTQLGWPNRRPRFYLLASLKPLPAWQALPQYEQSIAALIEGVLSNTMDQQELWLSRLDGEKYATAIDRVDLSSPQPVAACFAGSYGKTILRAGSYLQVGDGYRRFIPREVARLLGYPDFHQLSHGSNRKAWKLLGNSLSLPAVRYVISHLHQGPSAILPWRSELRWPH